MMTCVRRLVGLLWLWSSMTFGANVANEAINTIDQTCAAASATTVDGQMKQKSRKKREKHQLEVVTFTAQEEVRSPVLPVPPSSNPQARARDLHKFFTATENIDLQFADRATVEQISDPTEDLMATFRRLNSQRREEEGLSLIHVHNVALATKNVEATTRIVGLTNPPMHCLGLVLHSVTHVGIQVFSSSAHMYPELHLTLMETEFEATGPKFLVNLFDKIMQHEDKNSLGGKQTAVETIGFTRIWAEPASAASSKDADADFENDGVVFVDRARLEARIYVPSLLIRLLPLSKERMEKAGSATILKTIRKDMVSAMARLVEAYRLWITEQSS